MGKLFFPSWLLKAWSLGHSMTWEFVRTVDSQVPLSRHTDSESAFSPHPQVICVHVTVWNVACWSLRCLRTVVGWPGLRYVGSGWCDFLTPHLSRCLACLLFVIAASSAVLSALWILLHLIFRATLRKKTAVIPVLQMGKWGQERLS